MHILLIAINAKYIHSNPAVHSLKACAGEYSRFVSIAEFTINQQESFILQEIYSRRPDVVAFSCYIWNRNIIKHLIPDLHQILPDTDIWAGGPEVSYHATETIGELQLNGIMAGPGEAIFYQLVSAYANGAQSSLPPVLDGTKNRLPLAKIPFWQGSLADYGNRIIYYESSRGCPFSCSYCLSSIDKATELRPASLVCRELDFFLSQKVPQVKFVDRTFNFRKTHALPILEHILRHDNGITNFHFEIAADLLDEDYFRLLAQMRPGAVQLEIGVQSTNAKTISEIGRTMDFPKVAAAVRRICSFQNIHVHLDLIAGLPFESFAQFCNSFNDVYALRPGQLQLGFLKVLKGSRMELCAPSYGLAYSKQPPYEVLSTKWLPYGDVCRLKQIEEMVELYYNSGQFTHALNFLLPYFESAFHMYGALASWYAGRSLFGIQLSRIRKYEILLEFACPYIASDAGKLAAFKEYLTYDLYLRENMKNRPSFALPLNHWKEKIHTILHKESETHAYFPELSGCNYRELTKTLHAEVFEHISSQPAVILFCYEKRDPLTNNGISLQIL